MKWYDMDEFSYRASQLCRVLGNPKAYQILKYLKLHETATPSELARAVNRSQPTVSATLRSLREVQLVRYTRSGPEAVYRLKLSGAGRILDHLEKLVKEIRRRTSEAANPLE